MNKYVKEFCKRGLIFSGLGPIVLGIVLMCINFSGTKLELEGWQIFVGILTTYIIAFVHAGSSVFEQIEEWSTFKSLFWHLLSIYVVYLGGYLLNRWIPYNWLVVLIFSVCVIGGFLIIWLICFLASNKTKNKLNSKITTK